MTLKNYTENKIVKLTFSVIYNVINILKSIMKIHF